MSDVHAVGSRPLPARPNLAFERKAAKALLAALRANDADAWRRARAIDPRLPPAPKLADAQRVIAREYGFASWTRLVRYFETAERVGESGLNSDMFSRSYFASRASSFVKSFANRHEWTAEALAAYVPRFFGRKARELWGDSITEADAQLVIARVSGCLSWERLMALAPETAPAREHWSDHWRVSAFRAISRGDLAAVKALCTEHPELLAPSPLELQRGDSLIASAEYAATTLPAPLLEPIVKWLARQGMRLEEEQYRALWRRLFMPRDELQRLLDRGVDPNRRSPEGVPILELALLRMWPPESIDLLAARCTPRAALWIAAGLGDLDGIRRLLDRTGAPTRDAYAVRPQWEIAHRGRGVLPAVLDPEPEDLLFEALLVAVMNQRVDAATLLVRVGAPVNRVWGDLTVLAYAVGNTTNLALIQGLLDAGGDPDLVARGSSNSARSLARFMLLDSVPRNLIRKDIARMLGWDPEALLAERQAALAAAVPLQERVQQALQEAAFDAHRDGASAIAPVHLLFGVARTLSGGLLRIQGGVNGEHFATAFAARLEAPRTTAPPALPLSIESEGILDVALESVRAQARSGLGASTLILALLSDSTVVKILSDHGADLVVFQEQLARG